MYIYGGRSSNNNQSVDGLFKLDIISRHFTMIALDVHIKSGSYNHIMNIIQRGNTRQIILVESDNYLLTINDCNINTCININRPIQFQGIY